MARKNPLGKIKDVAVETAKAPVTVAGSVAKTAGKTAGKAAGAVTSLVGGRGDSGSSAPAQPEDTAAPVAKPAPAPTPKKASDSKGTTATPKAPAKNGSAGKADDEPAAKKTAAKKAPAKKSAAKKAPAKKSAGKAAPAKKAPAKKAPAKKSGGAQPEPVNVTEELGLDPAPVEKPKPAKKAAKKPATAIDAAADPSSVDVTPADVADVVGTEGPTTPATD